MGIVKNGRDQGIVKHGRPTGKDGRDAGIVKSGRPNGRPTGIIKLIGNVFRDEQGGEVLEYALVAGLIVVLSLALIGKVGTKVAGKWTSLNNSL